jgi:hypothetical protein
MARNSGQGRGLRPHIRIEVSFRAPVVPSIVRPIRSLIAAVAREHGGRLDALPVAGGAAGFFV